MSFFKQYGQKIADSGLIFSGGRGRNTQQLAASQPVLKKGLFNMAMRSPVFQNKARGTMSSSLRSPLDRLF